MLEAVGHPVAVNPDRELLRVAQEREWEVRRFVRPVRLRDRVPRTHAGIAAGALAAAAGGLVWWRVAHRTGPAIASGPQSTRSRFAAMTPSAMRMARNKSFFMPRTLSVPGLSNLRRTPV
jgi:hypothetical protein